MSESPVPASIAPAPAPATTPSSRKINTRAAGVVGLAVMCSRVLGLARDQIFLTLFGAELKMDAFNAAFRVPNLLRDLFAEGALSTAFVTVFSKKIAQEGDASAWRLANKVATLAVIVLSACTLLGILCAPAIIHVVAGGFPPAKEALTIQLAQIMFPFIIVVSLAALVMGMLNAKNIFGAPAMASSFFNLGSIAGGVLLGWWMDPHFGERALIGLSIATLIGGCLQLAVQLPSLWKAGFRFRPDFHWRDEGIRHVLRLMGPAVIAASAVQVNVMINGRFASEIPGNGPVSWLTAGFRLMQLPLGLFGVAIGTVTLPLVARAAASGNTAEFRSTLAHGMRLAFLLTIPSTVGLMILAQPIISVLYEHGKFTPYATEQTAAALRYYAIGLAAYSGIKVLAPAFYALDKRATPMMVSFASIGTNLLLNWIFTFQLHLGHRGLALSTGCVAMINFVALYYLMHRETKVLETRQMVVTLGKIGIAASLLAAVCWAGNHWLLAGWSEYHLLTRILSLAAVIAAAGLVFFATAMALRVGELEDVTLLLRRKLGRPRIAT